MTIDDTLSALPVDPERLRAEVREKYRQVAIDPEGRFHFHTGRPLARRLGYSYELVERIPTTSVEVFAGVANPLAASRIPLGGRIVDVGSGGGFDSIAAALLVGPHGKVIGIDMTTEMLERSRKAAGEAGLGNVEFRRGIAEELPVEDGWADMVISNGVINLVADKARAFSEINRVLRPGGVLQFGDIANGVPVSEKARRNIDLWAA